MELDLANLLRQKGLKVTPQRLSILKLLYTGGHFNGEQIYNELKKSEPSISLSTVYNALNTLEKAGLLNSFEVNGITWYEIKRDLHVNVFCEDSDQIVDVDVDLEELYKKLNEKGINVKSLNVVVTAECSKLLREHQLNTS
ncbi:Fur family transcriptional regulator [Stygiolobus caldivivus]|uniref:Transcriptional repressor n=1 Tax=Stygiolobus caldivivus TaxID=2824673 RepID=A0A8D5U4D0_9CREN|nr:Fur family transcriptional regulator [Stygiolobus caldivivus]BCU69235.1 transcriptional repressor [Stygiolobus caldivivus]